MSTHDKMREAVITTIGDDGLEQMIGLHGKGEASCLEFLCSGVVYEHTGRVNTAREEELANLRQACHDVYMHNKLGLPMV